MRRRVIAIGVMVVLACTLGVWLVARSRVPIETSAATERTVTARVETSRCVGMAGNRASPALQAGPRKLAARPRSEVVTAEDPTPEMVACGLASWYPDPALHTVTANPDDGRAKRWTRYFDGIAMSADVVTVKDGRGYVTRFHPEVAAPERPKHDQLMDKAKLGAVNASLFYLADYQQWQLPGTLGTNAVDFEMVIASWRLVYKVENRDGGTFVDAYTGQTVQTWSNYIQ